MESCETCVNYSAFGAMMRSLVDIIAFMTEQGSATDDCFREADS